MERDCSTCGLKRDDKDKQIHECHKISQSYIHINKACIKPVCPEKVCAHAAPFQTFSVVSLEPSINVINIIQATLFDTKYSFL